MNARSWGRPWPYTLAPMLPHQALYGDAASLADAVRAPKAPLAALADASKVSAAAAQASHAWPGTSLLTSPLVMPEAH